MQEGPDAHSHPYSSHPICCQLQQLLSGRLGPGCPHDWVTTIRCLRLGICVRISATVSEWAIGRLVCGVVSLDSDPFDHAVSLSRALQLDVTDHFTRLDWSRPTSMMKRKRLWS